MPDLSRYRKFVAALIGSAAVLLTIWAPGNAQLHSVLATVVSVATALGVYAVPNTPGPAE